MFEICVLTEQSENETAKIGCGQITIGSFREKFEIVFEYWSSKQYEQQWREAIERVINNRNTSCLVTSITDPASANSIFLWPMYPVDNMIAIQNHLLFMDDLSEPFDPSDPYRFVRPREILSDEGGRISEWLTTFEEMRAWLNST